MSDRITAVTLPRWGLSMTEGKVGTWYARPGAAVDKGSDLVDVETEKIANAFEAPVSGVLRRILTDTGETVSVGTLLGVISRPEVPDAEIDAFVGAFVAPDADEGDAGEADRARPLHIEVGGTMIRYVLSGAGDRTPVLLIHGFGGDANNWLFNVGALSGTRPVYSIDLPGHGGSGKTLATGTVTELADAVADFIAAIGLERLHLVGHSLGGAVASLVALAAPARIASLTLISPLGLGPEVNAGYITGFAGAGTRREMREVSGALFANPALVTADLIEALLRYKRLDGVSEALEALAGNMLADGAQAIRLPDALFSASFPLQVIWGVEDAIVPPIHAKRAASHHLIEGAGHMAHLERSGEVNALLVEFMERFDG